MQPALKPEDVSVSGVALKRPVVPGAFTEHGTLGIVEMMALAHPDRVKQRGGGGVTALPDAV